MTGDCFSILSCQSSGSSQSGVLCLLSGDDPFGRGLHSCKTSQGYVSEDFIYCLELELRVLCLFSLLCLGSQTIFFNLQLPVPVPTLWVMIKGLGLLFVNEKSDGLCQKATNCEVA